MITAPYMAYTGHKMKFEYLEIVNNEPMPSAVDCPIDFGDISAPETMAAGSVYSYQYKPGRCWPQVRGMRRPA